MEFSEIKSRDKWGVYNDFRTVEDAILIGTIPKEYENIFPKRCECGSEFIISHNNKTIRCCNPNCWIKVGLALSEMFKNFECTDIGPKTGIKVAKYCIENGLFKFPTHTEIFNIVNNKDLFFLVGSKWNDIVISCNKITTTKMNFSTLVSKLSIPTFDTSSTKIFKDIASVAQLFELYKSDSIPKFLAEHGVYDLRRSQELVDNLSTILYLERNMKVPLTKPGLIHRKLCITGSVVVDGVSMTRKDFLAHVNELCNINNVQLFTISLSNAFSEVDCVIADYPSNTNKYIKGRNAGILSTAQDYVDRLRKEVELCRESMIKN